MRKVMLGKTGLQVSEIGFGGIPITRISKRAAVSLIRRAFDLGINFIDTAVAYRDSEEKIGAALKGRREEIIIATKSGARTKKKMRSDINQSLRRLKTNYIDIYQCHGVNNFARLRAVRRRGGALEALVEAKRRGKIGHIGITTHSLKVARKVIREELAETIQVPFNFITAEPKKEVFPYLKKHPLGLIIMKPFAGGAISSASLTIKHLAKFPGVPIPGFEKKKELEEVVRIVEGKRALTKNEKKKIATIRKTWGKGFCRRCGYCLPCPVNINIPLVLHYPSFYRRFPRKVTLYGSGKKLIEQARQCLNCGKCEKKCPYQLPIRTMIKKVIVFYEKKLESHP